MTDNFFQCRDGVLEGAHPVARDEAFTLAGLQCQIQFGDYVETKHRSGFLEYAVETSWPHLSKRHQFYHFSLRDFLPKEYLKTKDAERRILAVSDHLVGSPLA